MENSNKKDATGKLKELAEDIEVCMMVTAMGANPFCAIPMTTKKVDESGNLWFLSQKDSEHNQRIIADHRLELLYSDPSKMEFLRISGTAKIHTDKAVLKALYDRETDKWFEDGDDSQLTAIEVTPDKAHYWDTQSNKYETLYHLGIAALTKDRKHENEEGELL